MKTVDKRPSIAPIILTHLQTLLNRGKCRLLTGLKIESPIQASLPKGKNQPRIEILLQIKIQMLNLLISSKEQTLP